MLSLGPYPCGSQMVIVKMAHSDMYVKDCGKSFVIATNSIVSGTRKDLSVWEQYIDCMMNGLSIRKTAVACGIYRNTAFLWRHKILDALQNMADDVTLDGIY